jgi:hypothetical protein
MRADDERQQRERLPHSIFMQLFENRWTQAEGSFLGPACRHSVHLDGSKEVASRAQCGQE